MSTPPITEQRPVVAQASATNWLPDKPSKIAVAMSGGVDSSAVAVMLAEAGHELVGLTAWTLNGPGTCCNDALVNAGRVCEDLGIPFDTVDLRAEFSHYVMDYYNASYQAGLTPNPCVECNRYVKWEALIDYAVKELGVDYVATGHYCRIGKSPEGYTTAYRAEDPRKDQTYMLTRVLPKDLDRALFPLGDYTKPEIVAWAKEKGIATAHSKESMDVCFVLNGQSTYLNQTLGPKPGSIVDMDTGDVVGEHEGYYHYTIGQRKGVKVAAGRPIYVIKTDPITNTVYVGDKHHLTVERFLVKTPNWIIPEPTFPLRCTVKIRYSTPPRVCTVTPHPTEADTLVVELDDPVDALSPGQIAAFYDLEFYQLLGGAFIEKHLVHAPFDPNAERELPDLHCQLLPNA